MSSKYGKVNYKALILCLSILIVVGIATVLVIVNQKKAKPIITNVDYKMFRSQFDCQINAILIDNNQIKYTIKIAPTVPGNKTYKNVKISFNVMGSGTVESDSGITQRKFRFVIDKIKLKKDGTYNGTFTYKLEDSNTFKSIEKGFVLIPFEASGTIKEFSS